MIIVETIVRIAIESMTSSNVKPFLLDLVFLICNIAPISEMISNCLIRIRSNYTLHFRDTFADCLVLILGRTENPGNIKRNYASKDDDDSNDDNDLNQCKSGFGLVDLTHNTPQ